MAYTFVEAPAFERVRSVYLDDDEYAQLQACLISDPRIGNVVPGSGGVRKLRWSMEGSGKRGGLRVVYALHDEKKEVWMLTLYAKPKNDNVPAPILKKLLEAFRRG